MSDERWVHTRTIASSPAEVFAVLADPARHHETEPGDWVRDAIDPEPITHAGQVFGMNMFHELNGGHYVMQNRVSVFDPDQAIGWHPGSLDEAGAHRATGWWWRYDLEPTDGEQVGTVVTLTYDWSGTSAWFRENVGTPPPFAPEFLDQSLEALETAVRGADVVR